ncbi:MAG: hypothetical protein KKC64_02565 [Spirochaetes bacterium]|nr:hypothetical protein [Spirochaetota bacterium]
MSKRRNSFCIIILILILLLDAQAQTPDQPADEPMSARLEWAVVDGARSYEIQVRPINGDIIITTTSDQNMVELILPPGHYQVSISAVNVFRRVFSTSPWTDFFIIKTAELGNYRLGESELYAGASSGQLTLYGSGFLSDTSIQLENGRSRISGRVKVEQDGQTILADFDLSAAQPGNYDLHIQNPGKEVSVLKGAVALRPRLQPELLDLDQKTLANDRVYPDLAVSGRNLSEQTVFILRGPDGQIISHTRTVRAAETEAIIQFNVAEQPGGDYELIAVNPGGLQAVLPFPVRLYDAIASEDYTYTVNAAEISAGPENNKQDATADEAQQPVSDQTELIAVQPEANYFSDTETVQPDGNKIPETDITQPEPQTTRPRGRRVWLGGGYRPTISLTPPFLDLFGSTAIGGDLTLGISFRSLFDAANPLGALGFELRLDPSYTPDSIPDDAAITHLTGIGASTSLSFELLPLPIDLGLVLKAGYGLAISAFYRSTELAEETILSQDSSLTAGLSLRYQIGSLLIEAGADWQGIFYVASTVHLLRPYLRLGFWLD